MIFKQKLLRKLFIQLMLAKCNADNSQISLIKFQIF
jgi:hypothetical protein